MTRLRKSLVPCDEVAAHAGFLIEQPQKVGRRIACQFDGLGSLSPSIEENDLTRTAAHDCRQHASGAHRPDPDYANFHFAILCRPPLKASLRRSRCEQSG